MEKLSDFIYYNRLRRGLTQQQFADKLGISGMTIHNIESGKHKPSLRALNLIAKGLEVDVAVLVDMMNN